MSDISITPGSVLAYADVVPIDGIAGASMTAGQAIYIDSNNRAQLSDCDGTATTARVDGILLTGGSIGQPIKYAKSGEIAIGGTVVVGEIYVLSGNAGGIAPEADLASGDYVTVLGVGTTAARIRFSILNSGVQVPA